MNTQHHNATTQGATQMETLATYLIIVSALVITALAVTAVITGSPVFLVYIILTFSAAIVSTLFLSLLP